MCCNTLPSFGKDIPSLNLLFCLRGYTSLVSQKNFGNTFPFCSRNTTLSIQTTNPRNIKEFNLKIFTRKHMNCTTEIENQFLIFRAIRTKTVRELTALREKCPFSIFSSILDFCKHLDLLCPNLSQI